MKRIDDEKLLPRTVYIGGFKVTRMLTEMAKIQEWPLVTFPTELRQPALAYLGRNSVDFLMLDTNGCNHQLPGHNQDRISHDIQSANLARLLQPEIYITALALSDSDDMKYKKALKLRILDAVIYHGFQTSVRMDELIYLAYSQAQTGRAESI